VKILLGTAKARLVFTWLMTPRLSTLLGSLPELAALYEAIKEFVNIGTDNDIPFETSHIVRAVDWARRTIARCITTSSRPLGNKDGPAMVNLVFDKRFGLGFDFLKKR
jgi:hypothetical protein